MSWFFALLFFVSIAAWIALRSFIFVPGAKRIVTLRSLISGLVPNGYRTSGFCQPYPILPWWEIDREFDCNVQRSHLMDSVQTGDRFGIKADIDLQWYVPADERIAITRLHIPDNTGEGDELKELGNRIVKAANEVLTGFTLGKLDEQILGQKLTNEEGQPIPVEDRAAQFAVALFEALKDKRKKNFPWVRNDIQPHPEGPTLEEAFMITLAGINVGQLDYTPDTAKLVAKRVETKVQVEAEKDLVYATNKRIQELRTNENNLPKLDITDREALQFLERERGKRKTTEERKTFGLDPELVGALGSFGRFGRLFSKFATKATRKERAR